MNDAIEEDLEEQEEEECPKCPPVGAPAWMATFADMATLLMAFFVLILSFAEFNVPKFKQISGSLKNAFGVQRIVPIVEQPKGTTILSLNFSPSPAPSVTQDMTQQTTDITKPDLEVQQKDKDQDGGDSQAADEVVKALEDAIARGDIEVEVLGDNVVVNFTPTDAKVEELPNLLKETLNAIEKAKEAAGKSDQDVLFGGLEQQLAQLAAAASEALEQSSGATAQAQAEAQEQKESNERAEIAEDDLKVALRQEIGQGLVAVDRQEDKVIITVGAGGAFPSGSAELTASARKIMEEIAGVNAGGSGDITVSGHTDNVPLIFGSQFRDNWDLAAARASSVVQALEDTGKVPAGRMQAVSFGDHSRSPRTRMPAVAQPTAGSRSKSTIEGRLSDQPHRSKSKPGAGTHAKHLDHADAEQADGKKGADGYGTRQRIKTCDRRQLHCRAGDRQFHLDKLAEHHAKPEPQCEIEHHADNGRGDACQGRCQHPVSAQRFNERRAKEYPQETGRKGNPGGDQRAERAGKHGIEASRAPVGADEPDKLCHHDQRTRGRLGHAKPIQHLACAQPAIMANSLLRHIGQHRIGTAKCHHRNLAEEQALLRIDMPCPKPAIKHEDRRQPQQGANDRNPQRTATRRRPAPGHPAVDGANFVRLRL